MSARIVETSFGTKRATINKIDEIKKLKGMRRRWLFWKFMLSVYFKAIEGCPVDTGALRASIRITDKQDFGGSFEKSLTYRSDENFDYYIVAGGYGVINPKHRREVDYAQAVHDGYLDRRGIWHEGNPFLLRAWETAQHEFNETIDKYTKWIEDAWAKGALRNVPPSVFNVLAFEFKDIGGP